MPISHAHISHVALCLCLQSRTVEAGLNAQNTALYRHQKRNDEINTNNKCGNPKKMLFIFWIMQYLLSEQIGKDWTAWPLAESQQGAVGLYGC